MTRQEFIEQKIAIVKGTMRSYHWSSLGLFFVSMIFIALALFGAPPFNNGEFMKFGLSGVTSLSGAALQGARLLRRNKLLELNYCVSLVDKYESLSDFDKKIIDKALDGIISK